MRILMLGPTLDHISGGIPAVVENMIDSLHKNKIEAVRYFDYCSSNMNISNIRRMNLIITNMAKTIPMIITFSPSVIHMHTSLKPRAVVRDVLFGLFIKITRKPFIIEFHGGKINSLGIITRYLLMILLKLADKILITTEEQKNDIQKHYNFVGNKIHKIPNPINIPEALTIKNGDETKEKKIIIVFASRLIKEKGVHEFVSAISKLKYDERWIAYIVGEGPIKAMIRKSIMDNQLTDRIIIMGQVPLNKLLKIYVESDIYVFPSKHEEGFPMSLFYAIAAGMAVIAPDRPYCREYLQESVNCLYVEPENIFNIAEKIEMLINNKSIREQMRLNNIKLGKTFSPQEIVSKLLVLYSGTIAKKENTA